MNKSAQDTAVLVNESAYYIRTVASLANNSKFIDNFKKNLNENLKII